MRVGVTFEYFYMNTMFINKHTHVQYSQPNPRFLSLNAKHTRSQHEAVFLKSHSVKGICFNSDTATNCSTIRNIDHNFSRIFSKVHVGNSKEHRNSHKSW